MEEKERKIKKEGIQLALKYFLTIGKLVDEYEDGEIDKDEFIDGVSDLVMFEDVLIEFIEYAKQSL